MSRTHHEGPAVSRQGSSLTTRLGRRRVQRLAVVPLVMLFAAIVSNTGNAGSAGAENEPTVPSVESSSELNRVAIPNFDPKTWKPTPASPLPTMQSPITFQVKDAASYWFDNELEELEPMLKTRSLAAGSGPTTIKFLINPPNVETGHTVTSILWPEGAVNMPFNTPGAVNGEFSVDLVTPGLYAWNCTIHPYMAAAAVIDDPATPGADFGKSLRWVDRKSMPSAAHEVLHVVKSFFTLTGPLNWQIHSQDKDVEYNPSYPAAPIMTYNEDGSQNFIPNLDQYYEEKYKEAGQVLKPPVPPKVPGVGTLYVDTQWEMSKNKTKPGSITAWDTETWKMKSKWYGKSIDLNNPHNQWTNVDGSRMFVTNWYGTTLATLDTKDGTVLNELEIGPSPSHVVSRSTNGNYVIPNNGGGRISEVSADGTKVVKTYLNQKAGDKAAMPHGHWVSGNGKYVITPNANDETGSIFNLDIPAMVKPHSGEHPVAATFTNDSKRGYISNLLSHDVICYSTEEPACPDGKGGIGPTSRIDLQQHYNRITGESTGPYAIAPIQLPISPDDKYMLIVGTFTSNVLVIDMDDHKIVKSLACAPGCHGINFGLKKGGGWYGYVSIKYANRVMVVDGDPNGDGDASDAEIAGNLFAGTLPGIQSDDESAGDYTDGQGGNGVFAYPVAYNGWVQTMPEAWQAQMTCRQREPLSKALC